jgi:hypothetical protein
MGGATRERSRVACKTTCKTSGIVANGEAVWSWRPDAGVKFACMVAWSPNGL